MRTILAIGVILMALMAACTSCNPPENDNSAKNTNANADSNNNQGPIAIATPPVEIAPSQPLDPNFKECNPYYPLIPGSQARYSLLYSTGLQANAIIVVNQTTEGGLTVFEQKMQIVDKSGGHNKNEIAVEKFVCDKGRIKAIAENRDNTVDQSRTLVELHYTDPAYTMLEPGALKQGATWSYSFTSTLQGSETGTGKSDRSLTASCKVQGEEDVTVPAGKFKALKVIKNIGKSEITEYYGRGMGLVKRVAGDGTTWELMSYSGLRAGG